jgi:glutathione S-transferase
VLHIAQKSDALLPPDPAGRARAITWLFAALNSVETPISGLVRIDIFHRDEAWAKEARPSAVDAVKKRLADLAEHLAGRDWLEDRFTVADLMMATVLRILRHTELVTGDPVLGPYLRRCEARPAFQKALADQMASFNDDAAVRV